MEQLAIPYGSFLNPLAQNLQLQTSNQDLMGAYALQPSVRSSAMWRQPLVQKSLTGCSVHRARILAILARAASIRQGEGLVLINTRDYFGRPLYPRRYAATYQGFAPIGEFKPRQQKSAAGRLLGFT